MGLGGALFEAIRFDDGKVLQRADSPATASRGSRTLPTIETVLVDRPDLPSAGAGESPIVAIAPAIGNALLRRDRPARPLDADGAGRDDPGDLSRPIVASCD